MSETRFEEAIKANVRGLWLGAIYRSDFMNNMQSVIERELWNAWWEGMESCGMTKADMEPEDRETVNTEIYSQIFFLGRFADDIVAGSKANGGNLDALMVRASMWINAYKSVRDLAKVSVCGDQKDEWVYGDTDHCSTCEKLNGIVKRASVWNRAGLQPGNPPNDSLECEGWLCQCSLRATTKPATPGPLPSVP